MNDSVGAMRTPGTDPREVAKRENQLDQSERDGKFEPRGMGAIGELQALPQLKGMRQAEIQELLRTRGFSSVPGRSGGTVWTRTMPDGNTAVVRLDPPNPGSPANFADAVEHAHKEIVPTKYVRNGNYEPGPHVTRLNDDCKVSNCPRDLHIPTKGENK